MNKVMLFVEKARESSPLGEWLEKGIIDKLSLSSNIGLTCIRLTGILPVLNANANMDGSVNAVGWSCNETTASVDASKKRR